MVAFDLYPASVAGTDALGTVIYIGPARSRCSGAVIHVGPVSYSTIQFISTGLPSLLLVATRLWVYP